MVSNELADQTANLSADPDYLNRQCSGCRTITTSSPFIIDTLYTSLQVPGLDGPRICFSFQ